MGRNRTSNRARGQAGRARGAAGRLEALLALHEAALDTMSHGVCMYDADHRVVLTNRRFLESYDMSPEVVRPGATMYEVFRHGAEQLKASDADMETAWIRRQEQLARGESFTTTHVLPNGRTIALNFRPMANGGWVAVFEDVTAQRGLQRELRVQFERMNDALGNMSHGLCLFDGDERLVICNEQYLRIYGLDPTVVKPGVTYREILGHAIAKGNHRDLSVDELYAGRMAMVRQRTSASGRITLGDGRVIETTTRPMADGGWVADHEDITERVRSEEALREQNLRFDAAIENMAHGISMFDADERLIVCNQQYLQIYGADPNLVKPGITYRELLAHGIAIGNRPGMTVDQLYDERIEVVRRDGTTRLTTRDGRMIEATTRRMPNGGWVTASVDITERQRHEEVLREQNMRFDTALENMAQGLLMLDRDLRVMVCNRRFVEVYRLDPATVRPGISLMELSRLSVAAGNHGNAAPDKVCALFRRKLIEGQVAVLTHRRADGRAFAVRTQPMSNGGWLITFDDITERERADRALREQNLRFDAAINNMSQGLCMFGADQRLIVRNDQYLEIFNLIPR
jgi:PAS domain-containing protein